MAGRCATCKWWTAYQKRTDLGSCRLISSDIENGYAINSQSAHVSGEALHGGTLFTAPDFGCVQHESKDDA